MVLFNVIKMSERRSIPGTMVIYEMIRKLYKQINLVINKSLFSSHIMKTTKYRIQYPKSLNTVNSVPIRNPILIFLFPKFKHVFNTCVLHIILPFVSVCNTHVLNICVRLNSVKHMCFTHSSFSVNIYRKYSGLELIWLYFVFSIN